MQTTYRGLGALVTFAVALGLGSGLGSGCGTDEPEMQDGPDVAGTSGGAGGAGGMVGVPLAGNGGVGGAIGVAGAAGGEGGAGGAGAAGGAGSDAMAGAGSAAPPLPAGPGCQDVLSTPPTMMKTNATATRIDYALMSPPGATHLRIALLLFNASSFDQPVQNENGLQRDFYSPEELGDAFFTDPNGVHAFMHESSYGKVTLEGSVVGWIDLGPQTTPAQDFQTNRDQYAAMVADQVDLADFDVAYIVAITDAEDILQLGWGLENTLAGNPMGVVWMINSEFWNAPGFPGVASLVLPSTSWAHELHHTIAISGHSNALDCGMEAFGTGAGCEIHGYGNPFSAMGGFGYATHADAVMKERLGWFAADQMTVVTTPGVYPLCPLASTDGKPKGLSIALPAPVSVTGESGEASVLDRLQIEYRRELGFDRHLSRLAGGDVLNYFVEPGAMVNPDGVLISLGYQTADTDASLLLDMHPTTPFNEAAGIKLAGDTGKFADAMLNVGESFELSGVTVTVESLTDDGGIQVRVEM